MRILNSSHESASPFQLLEELPFAQYEEGDLASNALVLHEGRADAALIPLVEYAAHGGYVGLDFGIACRGAGSQLFLYGKGPLHQLKTIYLHRDCVTGAVLLRLLVAERWRIAPRLVRMHETILPESLKENEGILVLSAVEPAGLPESIVCMDLVHEWEQWTGCPMVFNVWAIRTDSVKREHIRECTFGMHRCTHMYETLRGETVDQMALKSQFLYYWLYSF